MANLAQALDAALRAFYRAAEVKTPITQQRGLVARMNQLEKVLTRKGDRPGAAARRAAEAAGISPGTWRKWRKGTSKPAKASQRKLEKAYDRMVNLPRMRRALGAKGVPDKVNVTAVITWNGRYQNRTEYRTIRLLGTSKIMPHVIRAWRREGAEAAAELLEQQAPLILQYCEMIEFGYDGVHPVIVEFP